MEIITGMLMGVIGRCCLDNLKRLAGVDTQNKSIVKWKKSDIICLIVCNEIYLVNEHIILAMEDE
ncbi:MAG: hypothetical protein HUJ56_00575 [Erysipelotrichaceae bacterium]|nr:hypothetical protein [Erysipelotrichaceae bacterium]